MSGTRSADPGVAGGGIGMRTYVGVIVVEAVVLVAIWLFQRYFG